VVTPKTTKTFRICDLAVTLRVAEDPPDCRASEQIACGPGMTLLCEVGGCTVEPITQANAAELAALKSELECALAAVTKKRGAKRTRTKRRAARKRPKRSR